MILLRLLTLVTAILIFNAISLAQNGPGHSCQVATIDITGKNADQLARAKTTELGVFQTIAGEEELTTKVYRLPQTKLFVIASVWYTDESLASAKGSDSISLQLTISKTRKRDILRSLTYSDAEVPLNAFDVARVTTLVKAKRRNWFVLMECRNRVSAVATRKY